MAQIKNLDQIDRQILELLADNSRMSYVDIAKHVNLSRTAAKLRIESLEKEGVIEKFTIVVNPEKIGRSLSTYFDIEVSPNKMNAVVEELVAMECVTDLYQMTGSTRLHMHAILTSNDDLERFLREELYAIPDIVKIDLNIIVSRLKTRKGVRV